MTQPDFIASLKQIERDLAASAKLARATHERIKAIETKQASEAPPIWRKTPPDADGMWLLSCMEDPNPGPVRVFTRGGNVMADLDIGVVGLMDLHNGLTNVRWAKAEAPSPKRPRKQRTPKESMVKPTLQPTQKPNPISQSGHQGASRESLSTAPVGTTNDQ